MNRNPRDDDAVQRDTTVRGTTAPKEYEELITYSLGAVAGASAIGLGGMSIRDLLTLHEGQALSLEVILPFVLFGLTILLGLSWFWAGKHELALLARYLAPYAPRRSFGALPATMLAGIVIVVLAYFSTNVLVYGIVFWCYLALAVTANWLAGQHVHLALDAAASDPNIPQTYRDEVRLYGSSSVSVRGGVKDV